MEIKKLELGGGENPAKKHEGFINVDILHDCPDVDISCDLGREKLPFLDNSVSEIFSSHCLEHIEDARHFLNECHRVLTKNGKAQFIVPYGLWAGAQKPVHKQFITECWFDFLRKENSERVYGYKRWDIKTMVTRMTDDAKNEPYELDVILTPTK